MGYSTAGTYKGTTGTWNNYGEFTPSKPSTPAPAPKPAATTTPKTSSSSSSSGSSGSSSSAFKSAINVAVGNTPSYQGHINYFGGPAQYAAAIKAAEAPGGRGLSDPTSAAAFKAANAQYFSSPQADTSPYVVPQGYIKTNPIDSPAIPGMIKNDVASVTEYLGTNGSKYGNMTPDQQKLLSEQSNNVRSAYVSGGGNINSIPQNLWGSDPSKGFQTGVDAFINAAPPQEKVVYKPEVQPFEQQFAPIFSELQRMTQEVNQSTAPLVANYYSQMTNMINDAEAALIKRYDEMGSSVDPATQQALSSLKDTVDRQKKDLMEVMSQRGLLQSGIWTQADIDLSKGELSEQQKVLGTRLSDLRNQLNGALTNLTQNKIQAAGQYGTAAIQAAESDAQRKQQAVKNLADLFMKQTEISQKAKSDAAQIAFDREKMYLPYKLGPTPAENLPYTTPTANAALQHEEFTTKWPYEQQKIEYDINKPYYKETSGSSGGTGTAAAKTEKLSAIQQGAIDLVNNYMSNGMPVYIGPSNDVGASGGERYTNTPMTKEQAVNQAVNDVRGQIGDLGITKSQLDDVIELIYEQAGIPMRPRTSASYYNQSPATGMGDSRLLK